MIFDHFGYGAVRQIVLLQAEHPVVYFDQYFIKNIFKE